MTALARRRPVTAPLQFQDLVAGRLQVVEVPQGLPALSPKGQLRWHAYSRARLPNEWPLHELFMLHELVMMEDRLDRVTQDVDDGDLYQFSTRTGMDVAHPAHAAVTRYSSIVIKLRSALALNRSVTREMAHGIARVRERATAVVVQELAEEGDGLLAAPPDVGRPE